ncbi:hypothetical protein RB195_000939 [Necator americanus]|uniref:Calcineurin-like phosphoesterase domain-containing protein n=1 Tax=Necator americanus TaxID=51031 RepID=A0ABR1DCV5_NECAM
MSLGRLHRRRIFRLFSNVYPIVIICTIIWGEWLNFYYWRLYWNIRRSTSDESLGILIVADPQLVGFKNENHMLGPLTRWDSDKFLSKGFSHALAATQPDLVIFLGDLFDEGLEASETEIQWTVSRFFDVFDSPFPKIFISGDNDVGGEAEPVQSHLTTRFSHIFINSFPNSHKLFDRLSLTEVNLMNGEVTSILDSSLLPSLNLIFSHVPFAIPSYHDPNNFIKTLQPDLILSAHDHKAYVHRLPRTAGIAINSTSITGSYKSAVFSVGGDEPILELQTPTCSYRMGVYDVGYGFVQLEHSSDNEKFIVSFSILWLSSRFYALILYAIVLSFLSEFGISSVVLRDITKKQLVQCRMF